ncbi:DNA polymerase III PolC-type [Oxobacter pfennigii]|uniref:DNA polymerase III PolC-type n=1 Tax=Oxobacter pfennigii TaxID=36849 RepID=A0A0P8WMY4_9CLOT|nr:PHP domain-containing protein [Oxobacter pfennigii]KPU43884.1 DNA polymerase III PolC-type [Oxobacter pfennigii]
MSRADLHIHSKFSDGQLTPEEIIDWALLKGLKAISITDHDTISAIDIAENYAKIKGIEVVPGIELSTEYEGAEVHILGYFFDYHCQSLNNLIDKLKNSRADRAKKMVEKLKKMGISIEYSDIDVDKSGISSIGRPHIARALIKKGYCLSIEEAFDKYIGYNKPAYAERYKISPFEAIKLIIECGGFASLAHPGLIVHIEKENLIKKLKNWGLGGIEVFHTRHSDEDSNYFNSIALRLSLIATGGTDCHGELINGEPIIGKVTVPYENVELIKNSIIHGN